MRAEGGGANPRPRWRRLLLPALTVVSLVLVTPVLIDVYGSLDDITSLGPGWLFAMVVATVAQLVAFWELHRIVLRTDRWFDVAAPHLVGNSASHVMPGGSVVGAGVQARMMTTAGFGLARTMTAFGAIAILSSVANFVVLPLVVLVASAAGNRVDPGLVSAMWLGAAVLAGLMVVAVAALFRDAPWGWLARAISWCSRRLHRDTHSAELRQRLLGERDLIRSAFRGRVVAASLALAGSAFGDFATLYLALRAVGADVNPAAALAAFIVSNVAGLIPLTPGGLGFVEAGLAGVLTLAGATTSQALLAVAAYRLVATWLPALAGAVALVLFKRRHRTQPLRELLTPV